MADARTKGFRNFFCEFKGQVAAFAEAGEKPSDGDALRAAKEAWMKLKATEKKVYSSNPPPFTLPKRVIPGIKKLVRQANAPLKQTIKRGSKSASCAKTEATAKGGKGRSDSNSATCRYASKANLRSKKKRAPQKASKKVSPGPKAFVDDTEEMQELGDVSPSLKNKKSHSKVALKKKRAANKFSKKASPSQKASGESADDMEQWVNANPSLKNKKRQPKVPLKKRRAAKKVSKKASPRQEASDESTDDMEEWVYTNPSLKNKKRQSKVSLKKKRPAKKVSKKASPSQKASGESTDDDGDDEVEDASSHFYRKKKPTPKSAAKKMRVAKKYPRKQKCVSGNKKSSTKETKEELANAPTQDEAVLELDDAMPVLQIKAPVKKKRVARKSPQKKKRVCKKRAGGEPTEMTDATMPGTQAAPSIDVSQIFNMNKIEEEPMKSAGPCDDAEFEKEVRKLIESGEIPDEESSCSSNSESDCSSQSSESAAQPEKPHFPVSDKGREVIGHVLRGINPNQSADGFNGTEVDVTELVIGSRKLDAWKRQVLDKLSKSMNIDDFE